ncbi:hypothetical protein [Phaeobacter inhibens]|uniref:Uncharacterized protein n=1 Tax=Phaeobacter inhibens TaxID=221822 RepID=A0A2I7KHH5_9RHOB|nr:hypothetical protein [Phaeobacter inhibens]AUR02014.1 hypothetical protein PhaeoP88_04702 [Phaeobacter inhibens]
MSDFDISTYRLTLRTSVFFGGFWLYGMMALLFLISSEWVLVQASASNKGLIQPIIEPWYQSAMDHIQLPATAAIFALLGLIYSLEYRVWLRFIFLPVTYFAHLWVIGSLF